jgi:segregation and condensation protein A
MDGEDEIPELELVSPEEVKIPLFLEKHIRRRTASVPLRKRRVTLAELIDRLEEIRQEIEDSPPKVTPLKGERPSRRDTVRAITELAHQENLTELATELESFLQKTALACLNFEDLIRQWREPDRVGLFWSLLLLSAQSKLELEQQDFYGDLTIKLNTLS